MLLRGCKNKALNINSTSNSLCRMDPFRVLYYYTVYYTIRSVLLMIFYVCSIFNHVSGSIDGNIDWSITLVWTEIFQQLFDNCHAMRLRRSCSRQDEL